MLKFIAGLLSGSIISVTTMYLIRVNKNRH